jgi:D-alanine transaminase
VTQGELAGVDELFVTGTTTDVTPLVTLDGRPVGNGRPGSMARMLQEALTARMYATAGAAR